MATKITVVLEDDLDGGPADETVRFGLGGTEYEIDLSARNAAYGSSICSNLDNSTACIKLAVEERAGLGNWSVLGWPLSVMSKQHNRHLRTRAHRHVTDTTIMLGWRST
jgi:hypothetical protein